jgi:prephenate dehydratase
VASNGLAAERASQEQGAAAHHRPPRGQRVFGLDILTPISRTSPANYTRFWVLGRQMSERPSGSERR